MLRIHLLIGLVFLAQAASANKPELGIDWKKKMHYMDYTKYVSFEDIHCAVTKSETLGSELLQRSEDGRGMNLLMDDKVSVSAILTDNLKRKEYEGEARKHRKTPLAFGDFVELSIQVDNHRISQRVPLHRFGRPNFDLSLTYETLDDQGQVQRKIMAKCYKPYSYMQEDAPQAQVSQEARRARTGGNGR